MSRSTEQELSRHYFMMQVAINKNKNDVDVIIWRQTQSSLVKCKLKLKLMFEKRNRTEQMKRIIMRTISCGMQSVLIHVKDHLISPSISSLFYTSLISPLQ